MKFLKVLVIIVFSLTSFAYAQEESKPSLDIEIERSCAYIDIEGKIYENVKITFKSISADEFIYDHARVKVKIVDANKKKIFSKNLKNTYLYIFSGGQIQVGKPKFSKIVIYSDGSGGYYGIIREKEGVY